MAKKKKPKPSKSKSRRPAAPSGGLGVCRIMDPPCGRPVKVAKHGLCWQHYKRYCYSGILGGPIKSPRVLPVLPTPTPTDKADSIAS